MRKLTPVTTRIMAPESRSTSRPQLTETRARPSGAAMRNQGVPANRSVTPSPRITQEKAMSDSRNEPASMAMAMNATFPRPSRFPKRPFTSAPASGRNTMAHRYASAMDLLSRIAGIGGRKDYLLRPGEATTFWPGTPPAAEHGGT